MFLFSLKFLLCIFFCKLRLINRYFVCPLRGGVGKSNGDKSPWINTCLQLFEQMLDKFKSQTFAQTCNKSTCCIRRQAVTFVRWLGGFPGDTGPVTTSATRSCCSCSSNKNNLFQVILFYLIVNLPAAGWLVGCCLFVTPVLQ